MFGCRSWAQARLSRRKSRAPHRRVRAGRADEFYGDVVAKERAVREVHLAHPAAGESAADLVLAIEERASGQHRGDCTWSAIESERMLRVRLATNLLFNLVLAIWVFHDARTRRARKPLFASLLTLLWGPLGVAFWASDRPLATTDERRGGTAWVMARTFVMAITALVPAAFLLITGVIRDRSAVPGSLGATTIGVVPAALSRDRDGLGAPRRPGDGARRPLAAIGARRARNFRSHVRASPASALPWQSRGPPRSRSRLTASRPVIRVPGQLCYTAAASVPRPRGTMIREHDCDGIESAACVGSAMAPVKQPAPDSTLV